MFLPTSTYRIQTSPDFTLKQIQEITGYLQALGVSTIYSAPFFQAGEGSTHGYDVVNPHIIGEGIGDHDQFVSLVEELKTRSLTWLQDIVPNHMAFTTMNPWIESILELGQHSPYYTFFDINWVTNQLNFYGKVMTPFLGSPMEEVLNQHQIKLVFNQRGFYFDYFGNVYPLKAESYYKLLSKHSQWLADAGADKDLTSQFAGILSDLEKWGNNEIEGDAISLWLADKEKIQSLAGENEIFRNTLTHIVEHTNRDWHTLKHLLFEQNFQLRYWKDTESMINYRRFFTVNDLICLNIQDKKVFEVYHRYIKELVDQGLVQGLRVDHVDGLFDPTAYLENLRDLAGEDTYLIVEKILEADEDMPDYLPIQGTSGYEFLAQANQLFTDTSHEEELSQIYKNITTDLPGYQDMVFQNKMFILLNRMRGELNNLMELLKNLDIIPYEDTVQDEEKIKETLAYLLASFPVYRIYSNSYPFHEKDMEVIAEAFEEAYKRAPSLGQYLERFREIFNGVADQDEQKNANKLYFVMRCQQFTGPLAAKGVEDTTFYVYNRLISRNEVGDTAGLFGINSDQFHEKVGKRQHGSLNATATHDTKRGEDARMRINVLSEMPDEWEKTWTTWTKLTEPFLSHQAGQASPDSNDQYFLFQSLVGTYPLHIAPEKDDYTARVKDYMVKVIKEAKRKTSWSSPREDYEKATQDFIENILSHQPFLDEMIPFVKKVASIAATYSLGQTLLKTTVPGIPDVYQGTEFWDLSMVDPDNRRPVDYQERMLTLNTINKEFEAAPEASLDKLTSDLFNPAIKMFTLHKALQTRKGMEAFFAEAEYLPVKTAGTHSQSVLAFTRKQDNQQVLVVITKQIQGLHLKNNLAVGEDCWEQTSLILEQDHTGEWKDIFTNKQISMEGTISIGQVLQSFPVALLIKQ